MPEVWEIVQGGKPLSENELNKAADELLQACPSINVWLFSGELGAGKTTLIKAMGHQLQVMGEMTSPTFSMVNEYVTQRGETVYHFDFYRIKDEQEAYDIGTDEYFESGNFCFIEWPEKIPSLLPKKRVEIKIIPTDQEHRILQFVKHD